MTRHILHRLGRYVGPLQLRLLNGDLIDYQMIETNSNDIILVNTIKNPRMYAVVFIAKDGHLYMNGAKRGVPRGEKKCNG